jgi:inorganic phosphate transporter, PiT family
LLWEPDNFGSAADGRRIDGQILLVCFVIVIALRFDFLNGFHNAANSIATIVATRVLSPLAAVVMAAFWNFAAAFFFETRVAATIGKDIVNPQYLDPYMVLFGLLGAIIWNVLTWYLALPSSSSHVLVGGFAGAAVAQPGFAALKIGGLIKVIPYIVIALLVGMILGRRKTIALEAKSWPADIIIDVARSMPNIEEDKHSPKS